MTFEELKDIYSKYFTLGYVNASNNRSNIENRFVLISLIDYVYSKNKPKNPDMTYYSLIYKKPTDSASSDQTNTKLSRLLKLSDKLIITKKNTGNWTNINYDVLSKVIWKNAVYDLKQKQFTCQRIEYSAKTGQVNAIYFAEK